MHAEDWQTGEEKQVAPVGLLSFLLGLGPALVNGHEVAEHDGG